MLSNAGQFRVIPKLVQGASRIELSALKGRSNRRVIRQQLIYLCFTKSSMTRGRHRVLGNGNILVGAQAEFYLQAWVHVVFTYH
jgi:hypothetical protein